MLQLLNIGKRFSNQAALTSINLQIQPGEFFSLLGPSGCGKTTLLRVIAGLETAEQGEILLDGQRVDVLPAMSRPFNMVFQKYALFPHLTVEQNIAYGLKLKKLSREVIQQKITEVLTLVAMTEFRHRLPETLSGGQGQRIAIARALVNEPQVLLLDEPLSALDYKLREHMQKELRALQRKLGIAFIYVTHDQEEALNLSDRIGIMSHGKLEMIGTPSDIQNKPTSEFAKHFLNSMSCLQGELLELHQDFALIRVADGSVVKGKCQAPAANMKPGMNMSVYVGKSLTIGDERS